MCETTSIANFGIFYHIRQITKIFCPKLNTIYVSMKCSNAADCFVGSDCHRVFESQYTAEYLPSRRTEARNITNDVHTSTLE